MLQTTDIPANFMPSHENNSARRAAVNGAVGFALGWLLGYLSLMAFPSVFTLPLALSMPGLGGFYTLSRWIPEIRTRAKAVVCFSVGLAVGIVLFSIPMFFGYWMLIGGRGGVAVWILCDVIVFVAAPGAWFGFAGFLAGIPLERTQGGVTLRMAKSFLVGGAIGGPFLVPGFLGWGTDPVANAFLGAITGIVPFAISGALFGRALAQGSQSTGEGVSLARL